MEARGLLAAAVLVVAVLVASCGTIRLEQAGPVSGDTAALDGAGEADATAEVDGAVEAEAAEDSGADGVPGEAQGDGGAEGLDGADGEPEGPDVGGLCDPAELGSCDDGNPCTADACKPGEAGADARGCVSVPVADQTACDADGLGCTLDRCKAGICQAGTVDPTYCYVALPGSDKKTCVADGQSVALGCLRCDAKMPSELVAVEVGTACGAVKGTCIRPECDGQGACVDVAHLEWCPPAEACRKPVCEAGGLCAWAAEAAGTACEADGAACTADVCQGGVCVPGAPDSAACDDGATCTTDACDPKAAGADGASGCVHVWDDGACDDGNVCTQDQCAPGQAGAQAGTGCVLWPVVDGTGCPPDGLECTADVCQGGLCTHVPAGPWCLIEGACVAAGPDSANPCRACEPGKDAGGWTELGDGTGCPDDGLGCTADVCQGGACTHVVQGTSCLIDGVCQAKDALDAGGCRRCAPATSQTAWTALPEGVECGSDGYGCTLDACDGKGGCVHAPKDALCEAKAPCEQAVCDVSAATDATGCVRLDACPYGHACDLGTKSCLTAAPLVLVTGDGASLEPTNPALVRHVVDAAKGLHRTWVVFQSRPCTTVTGGLLEVSGPSGLRALVLDDQPGKAKTAPPVVQLPVAAGAGTSVCQGYPVVSADATSSSQAWLSWLEADLSGGTCAVKGGAVGGRLRLGLLDGTAVTQGGSWPKVAGTTCSTPPTAAGPLFQTAAFGLLDPAGPAEAADVAKRKIVLARPVSEKQELATYVLARHSGPADMLTTETMSTSNYLSTVHPVLVDLQAPVALAADAALEVRHWVVALTEKTTGTGGSTKTTRQLWAVPLGPDGSLEADGQAWATGTSPAAGTDTPGFSGLTAVCSVDAALDAASKTIGIALVVRRTKTAGGTEGALLLARMPMAGKAATNAAAISVVDTDGAAGDCRRGLASARIVGGAGQAWHLVAGRPIVEGQVGHVRLYTVTAANGVTLKELDQATIALWSTDTDATTNVPALAWRGLGGLLLTGPSTLTLAVEASSAGKRAIVLQTLLAP